MSKPVKPKSSPASASPSATTNHSVHIRDLVADRRNARKHNPRNIGMILDSLHAVGAARSIVIDEHNNILAGNGTVEAAGEAGITKLKIVEADGNEIVAVRRRGLTEEQKKKLALFDNRTAELAEWDAAELDRLVKEMPEALAGVFSDGELDEILAEAGLNGEQVDAEPQIDRAAELNKKWQVKPGDLWRIGEHRLLCGNSTKREDVERVMQGEKSPLMNTDPPYGVKLNLRANHEASNSAKGIEKHYREFDDIENDELTGEELQAFLESCIRVAVPSLTEHAAFYLWHPMLTQGTFFAAAAAAAADILIHRQIIWVKPHFIFGRGDYHWKHELCFYGWRRGFRPEFYGERNQDTVWLLDEGGGAIRKDQNHPTQKPVELFSRPILNHTRQGDPIYEPFAGSGSQFVACENLKRKCRGIEISTDYCAVVLERMSTAFPGVEIGRVE